MERKSFAARDVVTLKMLLPKLKSYENFSLHLSGTDWAEYFDLLSSLQRVDTLILDGSTNHEPVSLPSNIEFVPHVKSLFIQGLFNTLPDSIGQLRDLQSFTCLDTKITSLPENIGQLRNLKSIEFVFSVLTLLPDSIGELKELEYIRLGSNNLTALPRSLGKLINLRYLGATGSKLATLPQELGLLVNLEQLEVAWNQLHEIPEVLFNLINLKHLNLSGNGLTQLSENIVKLQALQELRLCRNQIAQLPEIFAKLPSLESLDLSDNMVLNKLPSQLQVAVLDLCGCRQLTYLPDDLVVTNLLDIGNTSISFIPAKFHQIDLRWCRLPINPQFINNPESITVQEVFAADRAILRQLLLTRMSYAKFVEQANPKIVDTNEDKGEVGQLLRVEFKPHTLAQINDREEPLVCLKVFSRLLDRSYLFRVPPHIRTCQQAWDWLSQLDTPHDYEPHDPIDPTLYYDQRNCGITGLSDQPIPDRSPF